MGKSTGSRDLNRGRRRFIRQALAGLGVVKIDIKESFASVTSDELLFRPIPRTGQLLPAVGLGTSATFARLAGSEDSVRLGEVLSALVSAGGRVIDTAPSYGDAERVAGQLASSLGVSDTLFWATKLNVAPRDGRADPAAAWQQLERSRQRFGVDRIDCVQVHNVADLDTQLPILLEAKQAGQVQYVGVTTTFDGQYDTLERVMRTGSLDFIGIDYAVDDYQVAEQRLLPLAADQGIAVLAYQPFGRSRLWDKVRDRALPEWAGAFGAATWAQFFIKFCLSHPAVTVVTPATSKPAHLLDNLAAGRGLLPDAAMRAQMKAYIAAL
jgi:aryl-alcohol dehydrogenase-like predicted oxidoreductase